MYPIAINLLKHEGYAIGGPDSWGLAQAVGTLGATESHPEIRVGVLYAHYGQDGRSGPNWIRQLRFGVEKGAFDRGMLVTNGRLAVDEDTARAFPVEIAILDWDAIRSGVSRISDGNDQRERIRARVESAVVEAARKLAKEVAANVAALEFIEWRDVERMLATVFERLGFAVELGPGSKDGGKDIILRGVEDGRPFSYAVEVKHWRSEQLVGPSFVRKFWQVVVREQHDAGVYLSTSGYTRAAVEVTMEIGTQRLVLQGSDRIVGYCDMFTRLASGIWSPPNRLSEILFGSNALTIGGTTGGTP